MQLKNLRVVVIIQMAISLLVFIPSIFGANIPDEVKALVFQGRMFSTPVTIRLPVDETPSYLETKSRYTNKIVGIAPVGLARELHRTDKQLLSFLIQNKYVKTSIFDVVSRSKTQVFEFVLYTEKLERLASRPRRSLGGFFSEVNGAERKLKSIDFVNDRITTPGGTKIRVISIKFSYTLKKILLDLPNISTVFEGRAKLHLDPDYLEWKLDDLKVDDRGETEYLRAIKASYEPFISEFERRMAQRRKNIANANNLIIGKWHQVCRSGWKGDVTYFDNKKIMGESNGKQIKGVWSIRANDVIVNYEGQNENVWQLIEISKDYFEIKLGRSTCIANRAK